MDQITQKKIIDMLYDINITLEKLIDSTYSKNVGSACNQELIKLFISILHKFHRSNQQTSSADLNIAFGYDQRRPELEFEASGGEQGGKEYFGVAKLGPDDFGGEQYHSTFADVSEELLTEKEGAKSLHHKDHLQTMIFVEIIF